MPLTLSGIVRDISYNLPSTLSLLFQDMFPEVDKEVIRTVLESKHGNVEAAVAAILDIMGGTGQ